LRSRLERFGVATITGANAPRIADAALVKRNQWLNDDNLTFKFSRIVFYR